MATSMHDCEHSSGVLLFLSFVISVSVAQECTIQYSLTEEATGGVVKDLGQVFYNGEFIVINNIWGVADKNATITQSIFNCTQGQYGYSWNRVKSDSYEPCYPETLYGASPFSTTKSTTPNLPVKLSTLKSVVGTLDISHLVFDNDGKNYWDFAYDIWFATLEPGTGHSVAPNITDEIMVWFGWNEDSNPTPVQAKAVNDGYAVYDYSIYEIMQHQWRYHQFRITGGQRIPANIDLKPFFDYVQQKYNIPDEWLCSIELGTETGDGTSGSAVFNKLQYAFN